MILTTLIAFVFGVIFAPLFYYYIFTLIRKHMQHHRSYIKFIVTSLKLDIMTIVLIDKVLDLNLTFEPEEILHPQPVRWNPNSKFHCMQ